MSDDTESTTPSELQGAPELAVAPKTLIEFQHLNPHTEPHRPRKGDRDDTETQRVEAALSELEFEIRDAKALDPTTRAAVCAVIRGKVRRLTAARAAGDDLDTLTLSNESMEAIGTSIQNAAGGVDFPLPEYVALAIAENLIASTWLRQRLAGDDLAVERERDELRSELATLRDLAHIGIELDNHHNAAICPYCTPDPAQREAVQIVKSAGSDVT